MVAVQGPLRSGVGRYVRRGAPRVRIARTVRRAVCAAGVRRQNYAVRRLRAQHL